MGLGDGSGREARRPSPDEYLDSLEPIGWRLGLERMRLLTAALGLPQHRFGSIHVVGTNGKSSVARMTAALLEAAGVPAGACLSPHTAHWSERTLIGGEEVGPAAWAEAVAAVARAAEGVNRSLEEGDAVTQFEAATAATFVALARARVKAAAIEAGLGGRLDATNTIPSRVTVLTSIGLDHTEWLGETELRSRPRSWRCCATTRPSSSAGSPPRSGSWPGEPPPSAAPGSCSAPEDPGPAIAVRAPGRVPAAQLRPRAGRRGGLPGARPGPDELVAGVAAALADPRPAGADRRGAPDLRRRGPQPRRRGGARGRAAGPRSAERPSSPASRSSPTRTPTAMVAALAPALERAVCTEVPAAALAAHGRPGSRSRPARELAATCAAAGLEAEAEPAFGAALRRARGARRRAAGGARARRRLPLRDRPARAALAAERARRRAPGRSG